MGDLDDGYHDNTAENDGDKGSFLSPPKLKFQRSMDMEFHDLQLDDLGESEHSKHDMKDGAPLRNGLHLSRKDNEDDSSSCDDSFGEASEDEEPDKQYLEELLDEEHHPERLNLLDSNVPPRKDKPQLQRMPGKNGLLGIRYDVSDSDSEPEGLDHATEDDESDWTPGRADDRSDTSSELQQDYVYDLSEHTDDQDNAFPENDRWNPSDDADNEEQESGRQDGFDGSPKRRADPSRPSIREQMERMGESTKKSFRTVGNRAFFSQPFKGLTKTLSGGRRKPRAALEQPEVA
jgi:hypothetical protein